MQNGMSFFMLEDKNGITYNNKKEVAIDGCIYRIKECSKELYNG